MTGPPEPTGFAGVVETHCAVVFFVGDRAYKLKKPVDLGFLDFRSMESRRHACAREVELNRRLAADVDPGCAEVRGPPWASAVVLDTSGSKDQSVAAALAATGAMW